MVYSKIHVILLVIPPSNAVIGNLQDPYCKRSSATCEYFNIPSLITVEILGFISLIILFTVISALYINNGASINRPSGQNAERKWQDFIASYLRSLKHASTFFFLLSDSSLFLFDISVIDLT